MALEPNISVPNVYRQSEGPNKTYFLDFDKGRIQGLVDGKDALQQFIFKALLTQRYEHVIYPSSYGSEHRMFGTNLDGFTESEIMRTITEALIYDERISRVHSFTFEQQEDVLHVFFEVETSEGTISVSEVI